MPSRKKYNVQILSQDGSTAIKTLPLSRDKSDIHFRSVLNGGLGQLVLDLNLPFDDFDEGNSVEFMNIVDVYAIDDDNPLGRRIYRGFISRYTPYIESDGREGVEVTCLGLVSLLSFSYYKNLGNYDVVHTAQDPEAIFKAIIDHFNTIYGGNVLSYTGSTSPVGSSVSVTFSDNTWLSAVQRTIKLAGTDWFWKIDQDGLCYFTTKPGTPTHTFTIGKNIDRLRCTKDSEGVINDVQVRRSGGTATDYYDTPSQVTFGLGSPATGKRTRIISESSLTDVNAANQRGNKEIADNKDEKIKATVVVNSNYDIESIKPGDTCQIVNFLGSSSFFSNNMRIDSVEYEPDRVTLELEGRVADFGVEVENLLS